MAAEQHNARRPTSFDVAKKAGVSRATVSHVLNGQGSRFPEATRVRVLDAAAELQYRPSPAGRALVTGRSDILVLLIPNTTFGSNLQDFVDAVTSRATLHGLSVVVRFAGRDAAETLAAILQFRPVAVVDLGVLTAQDRDAISASGAVPIPRLPEGESLDDNLNVRIGRTLAEDLLRNGPRPLAYAALLDERLDPFGPGRYEGMKTEARERGLPEPVRIDVPLDIVGATLALDAATTEGLPLGVGCYNDDVAIAVLAAGRALGLDVPRSLSVVGVDATEIGQLVSPRLTSVRAENRVLIDRIAADLDTLNAAGAGQDPWPLPDIYIVRGETN